MKRTYKRYEGEDKENELFSTRKFVGTKTISYFNILSWSKYKTNVKIPKFLKYNNDVSIAYEFHRVHSNSDERILSLYTCSW